MAGLSPARIGIFGGSFDPPHLAHLVLAAEARYQLRLERVLWVLTPDNPLKPGGPGTPIQDRIELLEAAIRGELAFELSRVDIDRPPPYYSYETVKRLGVVYRKAELVFLVGGDSLKDLSRWREPLELMGAIETLAVMRRPGSDDDLVGMEAQLPGLSGKVRFIDAPLLDISATDIRRRIAAGEPFRYFVPEGVYEIIKKRGLYGFEISSLHQ